MKAIRALGLHLLGSEAQTGSAETLDWKEAMKCSRT